MRQKVLWIGEWVKGGANGQIPVAKSTECPEKPDSLWTLYLENRPESPPPLPMVPVHLTNACLEDQGHDWVWRDGRLRYFSRVVDRPIWVLLIYKDKKGK